MDVGIRRSVAGVAAAGLVSLLVGCSGDRNNVEVWFRIFGQGACDKVVLEVNAEDANGILERDGAGGLDCVLEAALSQAGCGVAFSEPGNGVLRAEISGCMIPSSATLFHCGFAEVDISLLQSTLHAQCDCAEFPCDPEPPACVGGDPGGSGCEAANCGNAVDDDGDGLKDCQDPDCRQSPDCSVATTMPPSTSTSTTSTSTTSTSTTSTSTDTTTSTTFDHHAPPPRTFAVGFRLESASTPLGALQLGVDYSGASGGFVGSGGNLQCTSPVVGLFAPNDNEETRKLTLGIIAVTPFGPPATLVTCNFLQSYPPELPLPGDFPVTIEDSTDVEGNPATATVVVTVTPLP